MSGFNFGGASASNPPAAAPGGFSFGVPSAAPPAGVQPGGFAFGNKAAPSDGGFAFGSKATATSSKHTRTESPAPDARSAVAAPAGFSFDAAAGAKSAASPPGGSFGGFGAAPAGGSFGADGGAKTADGGLFGAKTAAPAGGLFGAVSAVPAGGAKAAAAPSGGLFGAADPAGAKTTAAAPAGGLFGAAAPAAAPTTPAPSGGLFGAAAPAAAPTAPAPAGGLFGAVPASAAKSTAPTPAPATAAAPPGVSFGAAPSASAAAPSAGLFGASDKKDASKPPTAGGFSFSAPGTESNAPVQTPTAPVQAPTAPVQTPTAPTPAAKILVVPPPPIPYQTKSTEEIINAFTSELEADAKLFFQQAERVASHDAVLRDSQDAITALSTEVSRLLLRQSDWDRSLLRVEGHHSALESTLDGLEKNLDELFGSYGGMARPEDADIERERSYQVAIHLEERLDGMGNLMEGIVGDLNAVADRKGGEGGEDLAQIVAILNAHYDTLAWLENATHAVQGDVAAVTKALNT